MRASASVLLMATLCLFLKPSPASAQWKLRLERLAVEGGGGYDGAWVDLRRPEPLVAKTFQLWLRLIAQGSLRDPRVLSFHIVAQPLLQDGRFLPALDSLEAGGRGNGLQGALRLRFFRASPVSGGLTVDRVRDLRHTRDGGSVDQDISTFSADIQDRNPLLPTTLTYESERRQIAWTTGPGRRLLSTDERTRALRWEASNSRTNLLVERLAFDQASTGANYVRRLARLAHQERWGRGSTLRSQLRYSDRANTRPFRTLSVSEAAHLRQSPYVSTDLRLGIVRSSGEGDATVQADARASLVRDARGGLLLAVDGALQAWRTGPVRRRLLRFGPRGSYSGTLPGWINFSIGVNALLEAHAQGSDGIVFGDVVQEPHTLGPSGQFELIRPFADPMSVVMTRADGGVLFEEGFDYQVVYNHPFTVVIALPGGRFEEDESVRVDYRYQVAPAVAARQANYGYDVTLEGYGIRFFHRRQAQVDLDDIPQDVLPVLRNYDRRSTGVSLGRSIGWAGASLRVQRTLQSTDQFSFRDDQASASLTVRLLRRVYFTGSARLTRLTGGDRPYDSNRIEYSLDWRANREIRVRAYASTWDWVDGVGGESFRSGGAMLDWQAGTHTLSLQLDHVEWTRGLERAENRISLRFSRKLL